MESKKSGWKIFGGVLLALVLSWAAGSACLGLSGMAFFEGDTFKAVENAMETPWPWVVSVGLFIISLVQLLVAAARHRFAVLFRVGEWLLVVVLPLWGFAANANLEHCKPSCGLAFSRPYAMPDLWGWYVLYGLSVLAYAVSRRRPEALRPWAEAAVHAGLLAGVLLCIALGIQTLAMLPFALVMSPWGLPIAALLGVFLLFLLHWIFRLVRRGKEKGAVFSRAGMLLLPGLGLWSVLQRLFFGAWPPDTLTQTCEWVLSELTPPPSNCHYLCTVAARGHARLVRPLRLGRRAGQTIVVNRQLAVANAFEDLLHQRWPRFGRLCRRVYDRLGLPVSRLIRNRWAADAVWLLMKPAEWVFVLVLLLFDPGDPEARLDRMYR